MKGGGLPFSSPYEHRLLEEKEVIIDEREPNFVEVWHHNATVDPDTEQVIASEWVLSQTKWKQWPFN